MCGIFGIYDLHRRAEFDEQSLQRALDTMSHRGPDASGIQIFNNACLGHRRLAIIDLHPESNQPFCLDGRYWITFNGEIYNYLELREELTNLTGCIFRTQGDTEVLLRAYQFWGADCVHKFNGMWAFAIFDTARNTLFCSRDRFGVKPFNYTIINGQLIFASEIKALLSYVPCLRKPNYNVIANFCRSSVGAQIKETWFENVFRLQPGHNLWVESGTVRESRYWNYPLSVDPDVGFSEAVEQYREIFQDAVRLRMRSDVPVGTTLSSGLDSTSIVSALRTFFHGEHRTYTAAFASERFQAAEVQTYADKDILVQEATIAQQTANRLGLTAEIVQVCEESFVRELAEVTHYLESGNSSPAIIPLMKVMRRASQDVVVVLEGQGADEMLLGYLVPLFFDILISRLKQLRFRDSWNLISSFSQLYSIGYALRLYARRLINTQPLWQKLWRRVNPTEKVYGSLLKNYTFIKDYPDVNGVAEDPVNHALIQQHSGGLVNLLHYGDAISMAHSLESRLPFMDFRLVELVFRLPSEFKIRGVASKLLHRKAMEGIVDQSILGNMNKFGFTTPTAEHFWLRGDEASPASEILLSDRCLARGLFRKEGLIQVLEEHTRRSGKHATLLFRLLSVELWFREFIDAPPPISTRSARPHQRGSRTPTLMPC
jgi:asparagine synthase (glutamine-hydrolysing)